MATLVDPKVRVGVNGRPLNVSPNMNPINRITDLGNTLTGHAKCIVRKSISQSYSIHG